MKNFCMRNAVTPASIADILPTLKKVLLYINWLNILLIKYLSIDCSFNNKFFLLPHKYMQISPLAAQVCYTHAHLTLIKPKNQGWHQIRVKLRLGSPPCILTRSSRWSSLRQKCTGPSPFEPSPCFSAGFPECLLFFGFTDYWEKMTG